MENDLRETIEKLEQITQAAEDIKEKSQLFIDFVEMSYRFTTIVYNCAQLILQTTDFLNQLADFILGSGGERE